MHGECVSSRTAHVHLPSLCGQDFLGSLRAPPYVSPGSSVPGAREAGAAGTEQPPPGPKLPLPVCPTGTASCAKGQRLGWPRPDCAEPRAESAAGAGAGGAAGDRGQVRPRHAGARPRARGGPEPRLSPGRKRRGRREASGKAGACLNPKPGRPGGALGPHARPAPRARGGAAGSPRLPRTARAPEAGGWRSAYRRRLCRWRLQEPGRALRVRLGVTWWPWPRSALCTRGKRGHQAPLDSELCRTRGCSVRGP